MNFIEEWISHFADNISESFLKKRVYNGGFIWHVFSFDKIDKYLSGDVARKAFDTADKNGAKYFELWDDAGSVKKLKIEMDAVYIDDFDEFYVVGADWSWTYIKTHESDCGPYFLENSER